VLHLLAELEALRLGVAEASLETLDLFLQTRPEPRGEGDLRVRAIELRARAAEQGLERPRGRPIECGRRRRFALSIPGPIGA
jgi:hypothetical protein